jgi:hypothetical protein
MSITRVETEVSILARRMGDALTSHGFASTSVIGDEGILDRPSLGILCSRRCPGDVIIQTYDAIRAVRDAGIAVAGGFHSSMEKECLEFLLRGDAPVVVMPARSIRDMRVPAEWRPHIERGRLAVVSPFAERIRRPTREVSRVRNEVLAAYSTAILVPHATPGGQADGIAHAALQRRQVILTFDLDPNRAMIENGAGVLRPPFVPAELSALWGNITEGRTKVV